MNKQANHYESYEAACAALGIDPVVALPTFSEDTPDWLKRYTIANFKLTIIAEAIREGRKPKPGEDMYAPVFYKDAYNDHAGFGFTLTSCDLWDAHTSVGERQSFFTRADAEFFGKQFLELHKDTKIN